MTDPSLDDLMRAGDPAFLDVLARVTDPERLRSLARRWLGDRRPGPRPLLLAYLDRPLLPLHEPLLARLLRGAMRSEDDELMGAFLVLLDRSVRRYRRAEKWLLRAAPRPRREHEAYRLLAVSTRLVWRRQTWRYFERLGRMCPARYVPAVRAALYRYREEDVEGRSLLDNWGLFSILYRHNPFFTRTRSGWRENLPFPSLSDLAPAPAFEPLWRTERGTLLGLMATAPCAVVRRWAAWMVRRQHPSREQQRELAPAFLESPDADVRAVGAHWSEPPASEDPVARWRRLVVSPDPDARAALLAWLESHQRGWPLVLRDALPLSPHRDVLWMRVLLCVHGPWKPTLDLLVRQLLARLAWRPADAGDLLPMLAEVLRHASGPAWAEALAGLVRLTRVHPDWRAVVESEVPGLRLEGEGLNQSLQRS